MKVFAREYGPVEGKQADLSRPQEPLSSVDLLRIACGLMATAYSESFLVAFLTPYAGELGLTYSTSIWLVVPLTNILTQPVVGALSDRCRIASGTRRSFLFLGTAILIWGQFLIAMCEDIANTFSASPALLFFLFVAIFSVGLSIQQVSLRALWADIVPREQLPIVFASGTFFQLAGYVLGYATTEVRWNDTDYFNWLRTTFCDGASSTMCFNVRVSFLTSAIISMLANSLVLLTAKEPPTASPITGGICLPIVAVVKGFRDSLSSPVVRRVWECSVWSWIAWWSFYIFVPHFIAVELFNGEPGSVPMSPMRQRYEQGVHFASGALFLTAVVGWMSAVFVPSVARACGASPCWLSSNLTTAACLLMSLKVAEYPRRFSSAAWVAAFGIPFAFQITVPYLLLLADVDSGNAGMLVSLPTISSAFGQLTVALVGGTIREICATDLGIFAIAALLSCYSAYRCLHLCDLELDNFGMNRTRKMKQTTGRV